MVSCSGGNALRSNLVPLIDGLKVFSTKLCPRTIYHVQVIFQQCVKCAVRYKLLTVYKVLTFSGRARSAVLARPTGRAVAVVVALRCVARRAVTARCARAVVAIILHNHTRMYRIFIYHKINSCIHLDLHSYIGSITTHTKIIHSMPFLTLIRTQTQVGT